MTDEKPKGTILRAQNGDVIGYDETGLVLRLSDRVIADIARRIGVQSAAPTESTADAEVLGDIDAWNLRRSGDWHVFSANLPGEQGIRQYRRFAASEDPDQPLGIVADAPGALLGILTLGGSRAAVALPRKPRFPWHITAPADDVGAVGMGGSGAALATKLLHNLREVTRDALLAEELLADRKKHNRAMPLYVVRAETDTAPSASDLAGGLAMDNLLTAARSLKSAAESLAKPARVLCVRLDYGPEDVQSDANAFRDGMIATMSRISAELAQLGFHKPLFLANPDGAGPSLAGWWELGWNHADHDLILPAPRSMFPHDEYGRPTSEGMAMMAQMDALALTANYEDRPWFCPTFLLAEREGDATIRMRGRALGPLVLEDGPHGFSLLDTDVRIIGAALSPDDPQDIVLTLDQPVTGPARVLYDDGAVRDRWQDTMPDGTVLHRRAMPCILPLH